MRKDDLTDVLLKEKQSFSLRVFCFLSFKVNRLSYSFFLLPCWPLLLARLDGLLENWLLNSQRQTHKHPHSQVFSLCLCSFQGQARRLAWTGRRQQNHEGEKQGSSCVHSSHFRQNLHQSPREIWKSSMLLFPQESRCLEKSTCSVKVFKNVKTQNTKFSGYFSSIYREANRWVRAVNSWLVFVGDVLIIDVKQHCVSKKVYVLVTWTHWFGQVSSGFLGCMSLWTLDSIHPSIVFCSSGTGSRREESKQRCSDLPLPNCVIIYKIPFVLMS